MFHLLCVQDQDPAIWSTNAQQIMKSATELRYSLLPFMYTQFYYSHVSGLSVIQPLFFVLVIVFFIFMPLPAVRHYVFWLSMRVGVLGL